MRRFWLNCFLYALVVPALCLAQEAANGQVAIKEGKDSTAVIRVTGITSDFSRNPIGGATVAAGWLGGQMTSVQTVLDGRFEIAIPRAPDSVRSDHVNIIAYAPGKALKRIHVKRSAVEDPTEIRFAKPRPFFVFVHDEDGKPIEGAEVTLASTNAHLSKLEYFSNTDFQGLSIPTPRSNQAGLVSIPWMPQADQYRVSLEHDDYVRETSYNVAASEAPFAMRMERGRLFQFQVHCEHDPNAVRDSTLNVRVPMPEGHDRRVVRVSDEGFGEFRLKVNDRTTLHLSHPTLDATPFYHLTVDPFKKSRVFHFKLSRTGVVRGRVIDLASDDGAEGVIVHAIDPEHNSVIRSAQTDASGGYVMECPTIHLEIAVARLSNAWRADDHRHQVTPSVERESEIPLLGVTPKSLIRGIVLDQEGNPAPNVLVGTASMRQIQITDSNGRFQLQPEGLTINMEAVGAMRLNGDEVAFAFVPDGAESDETIETTVQLQPACSVSGTVVDKNGQHLAGVVVQLKTNFSKGNRYLAFTHSLTRTGADGSFQFDGLIPSMKYSVSATKDSGSGQRFVALGNGTEHQRIVLYDSEVRIPIYGSPAQKDLINSDQPAPNLSCSTWHHTDPLNMNDLRGKVVLLNFWGTWCGPCKRELPMLKVLHELYADHGLVIIGVHTATHYDPAAVAMDIEKYALEYPIAIDDEDQSTIATYGITGFPTTLLIGRDGKVHGESSRQQLLISLRRELARGADSTKN